MVIAQHADSVFISLTGSSLLVVCQWTVYYFFGDFFYKRGRYVQFNKGIDAINKYETSFGEPSKGAASTPNYSENGVVVDRPSKK